jgi:hypothetical protein
MQQDATRFSSPAKDSVAAGIPDFWDGRLVTEAQRFADEQMDCSFDKRERG